MTREHDLHAHGLDISARDDLFGETSNLRRFAMLDGDPRHGERPLLIGDHGAQEINIGVARVVDAHVAMHLRARLAKGAGRRAVSGNPAMAGPGVDRACIHGRTSVGRAGRLPREHAEGEGGEREKEGDGGNPSDPFHDDILVSAGAPLRATGVSLETGSRAGSR